MSEDRAVEAGRGALFIAFAKAFFMLSGFLQRWLLTRILPAADYGAFSVVNSAISTVNNTVVQGTIQSVSKFTAEDDARILAVRRAGLQLQFVLGAAVGAAFFLLAPAIAAAVNAPAYVMYFRVVAAIPFLYAVYAVYVGSANGQRRFRLQASFDVGFSCLKTTLLLGGAYLGLRAGHGVIGAFVGFVAAAALILKIAALVMRRDVLALPPGTAAQRFPLTRLVAFMGGVVAYTLLINLALNYDILLLRRFAGAAVEHARADVLVGNYEALRNVALLPYQALIVATFVVFPLVSRSTFAEDREATRAYIGQTLRYALIVGGMLAVPLLARPSTILGVLYKPEYREGAAALPFLAGGIVFLALLSVCGTIVNASGRPRVAVALVATTVVAGAGLATALVPGATPGPAMLTAAATAGASGSLVGVIVALLYLRHRFAAGLPPASVARVALAAAIAIAAARAIPASRPLHGLLVAAGAAVVYFLVLVVAREFSAQDRSALARVLRVRRRVSGA